MKYFRYAIFIVFLTTPIFCWAQKIQVRKVDDVGNVSCDDYLGRTLVYVNELRRNPEAKAYIVIYEGKTVKGLYEGNSRAVWDGAYALPALLLRKKLWSSLNRRLQTLGLDDKTIIHGNGGYREKLSVELWIIPPGGDVPKPTPTIPFIRHRKVPAKGFCMTM